MIVFSDRKNNEIDFLIKNKGKIAELIQVTYISSKTELKEQEYRSLITASKDLHCDNLLIITWDYGSKEKIEGKTINFILLWKWLLNLN